MLFADTRLAARIERAECRLLAAGIDAIRRRIPDEGPFVLPLAGGQATYGEEGSPFNKIAGLGFGGPLDGADLERVETAFAERGAPVQVEISILGDPSIPELLTRRGYGLVGFENVLGLRLGEERERRRAEDVAVAASGDDDFEAWLDVVVTGFATPDTQGVPSHESFPRDLLERTIGDMASAEGFRRYLARREGAAAGAASMRLDEEGIAQLSGAATLPEHRRRGVQSTLLAARLEEASNAGCEVAVVTTQPGSKSQENVQRQGFELLYTRAVLIL